MPPDYHAPLLVGYFDYAILAVLVLANAWYAQRPGSAAPMRWAKWVAVLLFGIVLPLLSIRVEMDRTQLPPGVPTDSFELLYTLFRFPGYWVLLVIQVGVFQAYNRRKRLLSLLYRRQHPRP
jgi:hypothetical protein